MLKIFKTKSPASTLTPIDSSVEIAALEQTGIPKNEIARARAITAALGKKDCTKDNLISALQSADVEPQIINRFYGDVSKETSTRRILEIAKRVEADGGRDLGRSLLITGVLTGNSPTECWEALGHKFAQSADWKNTEKCNANAIRLGGLNFYRAWHAATLNFIMGDTDQAVIYSEKTQGLAQNEDQSARAFPLKILSHLHKDDASSLSKHHAAHESNPAAKQPDWVVRRISQAYSGLIKSEPEITPAKVALMRHAEDILSVNIDDPSLYEYMALACPEDVDIARQYLNAELAQSNPSINSDVLAVVETVQPRQAQDIPLLLAAYSQSGRVPDALRIINEAESDGASLYDILEGLTKSLKNKQHSLELLKEGHRQNPANEKIARLYGMTAHVAGQQGAVVDTLLPLFETSEPTALEQDETYALALALQMTNRPEKAIEALNSMDVFSDNFLESQHLRQRIYYQLGDFPSCIKVSLEVLKGNPEDTKTLRQVMIAYRANAEHEKAVKTATKLLSVAKPRSVLHKEALTVLSTEAALTADPAILEKALEQINPLEIAAVSDWNFSLQLIAMLTGIGAVEHAYDVGLGLMERNAKSPTLLLWMGVLKNLTGRMDVQLEQSHTAILAQAHGLDIIVAEGQALIKQGDIEGGLTQLLEAQNFDNDNLHLYKLIGQTYVKTKEPQKAVPHLKRALKLTPEDSALKALLSSSESGKTSPTPELVFDDSKILSVSGEPKITIVVPCYNEARFLGDCLNSLWMQSYPYWECIIVDDRGTDQSAKIAKAYCAADSRFKYHIHEQNKGLAGARNTGLDLARADYVTFLDADDFLSLDSLNSRYQVLLKRDSEFLGGVYCQIRPCDEDKMIPLADVNQKRITTMTVRNYATSGYEAPFNAHAPLLKTQAIRDVEGFTESMKHGAEDWDCWQRMMRKGYSFLPSNWVGGYYRQKRGSMVRAMSKFHVAEAERMYQRVASTASSSENDRYDFKYPTWVYQGIQDFYKRALRFAAMAHMAGDMDGFDEIVSRLPGSKAMCEAMNFSITPFIKQGVDRFLSSTDNIIGSANRDLYKQECATEIADKIWAYLEDRHPDTNIETFFPQLSQASSGTANKAASKTETFTSSIPAYVKLEESQKRLKDADRIKKLHNIHAGERVFIVGNGPSLNKIDLSKLKDEYSFAVNGIFYKTKETGYRPNYYVVEDTSVMRENIAEIKAYEVEKKFFPTIYTDIHPADDNTYFFKMNRGFYEPKSPNYCVPRFSTDFSQRAFCGQSVTIINLQLAFYMGFTEVYLIGMDFSYIIPDNFERKGDIITSTDDDPNHFHPDYFGKGKTWKDPKLDRVLANYEMAKLAYETSGRKIYNATVGGKLEIFERRDFKSLF